MGAIGGGLWNFAKAYRNAPFGERFASGLAGAKARAPILGGNFAVWGFLFSTCECTFISLRNKEDAINSVASGAISGGLLAVRSGWRASMMSALFGGVFLALIEGVGVSMNRLFAEGYRPPASSDRQPPI